MLFDEENISIYIYKAMVHYQEVNYLVRESKNINETA